jgi:hypothetical protein
MAPICRSRSGSITPVGDSLFCRRHLVLVEDNARCLHWQPAVHWLRANREVADSYSAFYLDPTQQLSPSERAYLHRAHSL